MISQPAALPFCEGTEGIWLDLPAETYHAAPGCSHSMLKHMKPPARLPAYLARTKRQTPAMLFGSVVHHLVLTPRAQQFWIVADMRTTEGKKLQAANPDATPISQETLENATAAAAAVMAHKEAAALLDGAQTEVSVFHYAHHLLYPVLGKARIDIKPTDPTVLADLKTCRSADEDDFGRDIEDEDYHGQGAWYIDINNASARENRSVFKIIAVEKEPPFLVNVAPIDAEDIQQGREQNTMRLEQFSLCSKSNIWPGYMPGGTFKRTQWARLAKKREEQRLVERAVAQQQRAA